MASDRHFGLGKETVYKTPVAPTKFFQVVREDLERQSDNFTVKVVNSVGDLLIVEDMYVVRGSVEVILGFQDLFSLVHAFLSSFVGVTGAGPYTHVYPASAGLSAATRLPFTAEMRRDNDTLTWRYAGCIITGLAIAIRKGQEGRATIQFVGAADATGTAAVASFLGQQDIVIPSLASVEIDTVAQSAQEANLNMLWPVDEPGELGAVEMQRTPETSDTLSIEGDTTIYAEDQTVYNKFTAQDDVQIEILADNGSGSTIQFLLTKTKLTRATPHIEGRARQLQPVGFKGFSSGAAATDPLQVTIVNDQSADAF